MLPIGVSLRVGLDGSGWEVYEEHFWEQRLLHFEYAYRGLPALDAEEYLTGENILGVALAALMRVSPEQRVELKKQAFERLAKSAEGDARRYLLYEWMDAYLPLEGPQLTEFVAWLDRAPDQSIVTMGATIFGMGPQKGELLGLQRALKKQREVRFGALSPLVRQRLEQLSVTEIEDRIGRAVTAESLRDLGLTD